MQRGESCAILGKYWFAEPWSHYCLAVRNKPMSALPLPAPNPSAFRLTKNVGVRSSQVKRNVQLVEAMPNAGRCSAEAM